MSTIGRTILVLIVYDSFLPQRRIIDSNLARMQWSQNPGFLANHLHIINKSKFEFLNPLTLELP